MNRGGELIAAYLDDALTEAEEAELNAWLSADAANVRAFVEANMREQQLRAVVQARGQLRLLAVVPGSLPMPTLVIRRRASTRLIATWAAAVAIMIVSAWMLWKAPALHLARLRGDLTGAMVERDGALLDAVAEMRLAVGDVVRVQHGGARIEIVDEDTHFTLAPRSAVALRELRGQKRFELLSGSVAAEVAKQRDGAMIWLTDDAEAQVLGTKFELSADGLLTRLDVTEGAVQFQGRAAAETTIVRAGQLAATDSQGVVMPRESEPWQVLARTTAGCEHVSFHSRQVGTEIGVNVLLPPHYQSESSRRFPVLYFLHGLTGNEHTEAARFNRRFMTAMQSGELPPFIAVFPNGGPGFTPPAVVAARIFTQELPGFIDSRYRTQSDRSGRMVCGIGFGGKRAVLYATLDTHVFGSGCAIDDTFHGGTPSFSRLLNTMRYRIERHPPHVFILHGQPWATAKVDKLATAIRASNIAVETKSLPALPPESPEYAEAITAELRILLTAQWGPR